MLNKLKACIIKKLGGYTADEYKKAQSETTIMNRINTVYLSNRDIKTLRFCTTLPDYVERKNFDIRKYALGNMVDEIADSGALKVTEYPNPRLCGTDFYVTLKIVV